MKPWAKNDSLDLGKYQQARANGVEVFQRPGLQALGESGRGKGLASNVRSLFRQDRIGCRRQT